MTTVIILALSVGLLIALYYIISHRRRTAWRGLIPDALPEIEAALPLIAGLTGSVISPNNKAEVFQDGKLFDAMLTDIEHAQITIHLETYIWSHGDLERKLVDLLLKKSKEGVKVRVIVDALGARKANKDQFKKLISGGAELVYFRHFLVSKLWRFNNRMHRKALIIDGEIGYTFGHGIADEWLGSAQDHNHWRDTGVRLQGPVVQAIQSVFVQDWCSACRTLLFGNGHFYENTECGTVAAHVVSSSTRTSDSSVAMLYMLVIASARHEVIIQSAYFTPDRAMVDLIIAMARRGVAVHVMVPGKYTDSPISRHAGQHLYKKMLHSGVHIYEYSPTFLHQKVVIIDEVWSHIGSTNFDSRSLALNAEMGVGLLDREIAKELRLAFFNDVQHSQKIILSEWQRRKNHKKVIDWCAYKARGQI